MKITLAAIAATAVLTMTGCNGDDAMQKAERPASTPTSEATTAEPEPTPEPEPEPVTETVTETAEAPEPEPEEVVEDEPVLDADTTDTVFVTLIRDTYPLMFLGVSDRDMIDLGKGVCGQFDIGQTFNDVVLMGVDAGYTFKQIGGFIGASTAAYCPEHTDVIP